MTKSEFLTSLPDIIYHNTWGYSELNTFADSYEKKGANYRTKDKTCSYGTFGKSWLEVSELLKNKLIKDGYIKE